MKLVALKMYVFVFLDLLLQCSDTVGWVAGASGL